MKREKNRSSASTSRMKRFKNLKRKSIEEKNPTLFISIANKLISEMYLEYEI